MKNPNSTMRLLVTDDEGNRVLLEPGEELKKKKKTKKVIDDGEY